VEKKKSIQFHGTRAVFNDILPAYLALKVVKDIIMLLSVIVQKNIEKGKNQNYKAHGLNSISYGNKSIK